MFVRKKKNRSGTISVVVVDKSRGKFREVKKFGVALTDEEADALVKDAQLWLHRYGGMQYLDFDGTDKTEADIDYALTHISKFLLNAPQTILGRVYDSIGFDKVEDDILRHLVIARCCEPQSKLATSAYLKSYFDEDISHFQIYKALQYPTGTCATDKRRTYEEDSRWKDRDNVLRRNDPLF